MLVRQAKANQINIMIETSGRDVAMYHYVDTFFPSELYHKLVLNFQINDLKHAESSVDGRMVVEMEGGVDVLKTDDDGSHMNTGTSTGTSTSTNTNTNTNSHNMNVRDLINVNAGGPYGSDVLKGIQRDSNAVWKTIVKTKDDENDNDKDKDSNVSSSVGHDWYKASIKIEASADKDWTARAVLPNGTEGEVYTFEKPRKV